MLPQLLVMFRPPPLQPEERDQKKKMTCTPPPVKSNSIPLLYQISKQDHKSNHFDFIWFLISHRNRIEILKNKKKGRKWKGRGTDFGDTFLSLTLNLSSGASPNGRETRARINRLVLPRLTRSFSLWAPRVVPPVESTSGSNAYVALIATLSRGEWTRRQPWSPRGG